jgi:hypothetical protein
LKKQKCYSCHWLMNCLLGSICIKRNQMCLACLLTIDWLPAWVYEWMNVVGLNLSFWADNLILVCSCLAACIAGLSRDLSDHLPCACMWCDASATPAVYVQKHKKTTIPSSNEQIADASGVRTVEWIGRHTMIQSQVVETYRAMHQDDTSPSLFCCHVRPDHIHFGNQ